MICYHGTDETAAVSILHEGFRKGTYFAFDMWDAVKFGGRIVFEVKFEDNPEKWHCDKDSWQFHLREHHPRLAIVSVHKITSVPFVTATSKNVCRSMGSSGGVGVDNGVETRLPIGDHKLR